MNPKLSVVSLWLEDVPAGIHFYQDLLKLPRLDHLGPIPHLDAGGATLVLLKGRALPAADAVPPRFPLLALEVPDLDGMLQTLRDHGVPLTSAVVEQAQFRWILCHDPGGNLIELLENKE